MKGKVGVAMMTSAAALSIGALSSSAPAEDIGKTTSSQLGPSRLAYTRLYCTPDHESHFGDLTAELAKQDFAPPAAAIYIGGSQPASSVFFAGFEPHWGAADLMTHLYHPTPAVQLFTVAEGVFSITTTDGETSSSTPATWSIWKTLRLAKGTLRSWATQLDSWFSRVDATGLALRGLDGIVFARSAATEAIQRTEGALRSLDCFPPDLIRGSQ